MVRARSGNTEIDFILKEVMYKSGLWRTVASTGSVNNDYRGTVNPTTDCVPLARSFRMSVPESRLNGEADFLAPEFNLSARLRLFNISHSRKHLCQPEMLDRTAAITIEGWQSAKGGVREEGDDHNHRALKTPTQNHFTQESQPSRRVLIRTIDMVFR